MFAYTLSLMIGTAGYCRDHPLFTVPKSATPTLRRLGLGLHRHPYTTAPAVAAMAV